MPVTIEEQPDDDEVRQFLLGDRVWAAYAICDLEPPMRSMSRFWASRIDGQLTAALLAFQVRDFAVLASFGDAGGVAQVLESAEDLPSSVELGVRFEHLNSFTHRYDLIGRWDTLRMHVTPTTLNDIAPDPRVEELTAAAWPAVLRLFDDEAGNIFGPTMPENGIYRGVREGNDIVAVANTHVVSTSQSIAAVGGVYTRPDRRGRGMATATTNAVTRALARSGIRDIVLNARADNVPAVCAYTRIGYVPYLRYTEARAVLRNQRGP